ncbi:MAG: glycosyltransferase family 2 protein [Candidatus Magnetoovum sp. WYHC-5]|nr:glycosyltransferase family 2 protein [Candidatus Magnetoovum sp. WYHC-5]
MENKALSISVVVPVYGCDSCLDELCRRLTHTLADIAIDYEIILVNDSSPDNSWQVIHNLTKTDKRIKAVSLSRNFGQHYAITAGLDIASGDYVVVMDCDLQDRPEEIKKLYYKAIEGYDVVFGRRVERQDGFFKNLSSKLFYTLFNYLSDNKFDNTVANFSISRRYVIENFRKLREHNRAFPLFIQWMGFNIAFVDIVHDKRFAGQTSYGFSKLINLAMDIIVSQSNKPLRLSIKFGFLISLLSLVYGIYLIIKYFLFSIHVTGWTSIMVSFFFLIGLLFANMGILGLYIGKVFDETKGRPLYIIKDTINLKDSE